MMVSIGIAWSVLPRRMLDEQVVSLPLPGVQLTRQLGYIQHRNAPVQCGQGLYGAAGRRTRLTV